MKVNVYKYGGPSGRSLSLIREGVEMSVDMVKKILKTPNLVVKTESGDIITKENVKTVAVKEATADNIVTCTKLSENGLPSAISFKGLDELPDGVCKDMWVEYYKVGFGLYFDLETIEIPDAITEIPAYAFQWNKKLNIQIPPQITKIGESAFSNCTSMNDVVIPHGCDIGSYAFSDCTSLNKITFEGSVSGHGTKSFINCADTIDVYYSNDVARTTAAQQQWFSSDATVNWHWIGD